MEFHSGNYLYRNTGRVLHKSRPASSLLSVCTDTREVQDFQLHRERIEAELEILTAEKLSIRRHNSCKYVTLTVPSSVKHQVTERPSIMARPRSPQKKNDEYLQSLLDEQLSVIRQQLNSLSSERAKMEQRMEDLTNGIKEARQLSARMRKPAPSSSTPGNIRRARSVEAQKTYFIKTDSQYNMYTLSPPSLEEVDEGISEHFARRQLASVSSLGSSQDGHCLSESMNSNSVFSSSVTSLPVVSNPLRSHYRPRSVSDFLEEHISPTPIPELPESPSSVRSVTPSFFATYSPRVRPRTNSTFSPINLHSPRHRYSQASPFPSGSTRYPGLLSPEDPRPRSGSLSILASPRLAIKVSMSSQEVHSRPNTSPPHKKKSPGREIKHAPKDQQLSYFRKNSLTDDSSFKESRLSITDDECELKGSSDNLSQNSSTAEHDAHAAKSSGRVLRRSSLTGQIESVTNLKSQVRRNSSFVTSTVEKLPSSKNTKRYSQNKKSNIAANTQKSKLVFLNSKETTV